MAQFLDPQGLVTYSNLIKGELDALDARIEALENGGKYMPISGGTFTGNVTMGTGAKLSGIVAPVNDNDAVNKAYVDSKGGSGTLEFVTAAKGSLSRDNGVQLNVDYSTGGKLVGVAADIRQDIAGVWNDGHFFCTLPSIPVNQEQLLNRQDWKQTGFWINGNNSFTGSDKWWLTPYTVSVDTSSKNNYNIWIYFSPKAIQMTASSTSLSLVSVTSTGLTRAQILIAK